MHNLLLPQQFLVSQTLRLGHQYKISCSGLQRVQIYGSVGRNFFYLMRKFNVDFLANCAKNWLKYLGSSLKNMGRY